MAEAIKKDFDPEFDMIEGSGGVFDVHVDGVQIWDKNETGRFPEDSEILDKLKAIA